MARRAARCIFASLFAATTYAADSVDFAKQIQPILKDNCYKCHGEEKKKGGLRLDNKADALKGGDNGLVIVPRDSAKSPLYQLLIATNEDDRMPQKADSLSAAKIKLIREWIDQGAIWPDAVAGESANQHWAYQKVVRSPPPAVKDKSWPRSPIDQFLLARLEKEKLKPSPETDRSTFIRRLSFDLTGLPPTVEEVDVFLADKSTAAYEKLVERLLASPHYGERMALYWLDVVRYADSIGYHSDNPRNVSPYRDYVIRAFNENKPFDQFTIEQLAGDLLPNAGTWQKVASCYNRLLQTTEEGGAQPKEYMVKYDSDRVRNTSVAWLGSTMGCAECHNHKFDPFTARDFYSFAAFFADVNEAPVGRREDGMPVISTEQTAELKQIEAAVATAKAKLDATTPELTTAQTEWEKQLSTPVEWAALDPQEISATSGTTLVKEADGIIRATSNFAAKEKYKIVAKTNLTGIAGFRLELFSDSSLPAKGVGTADNGNFVLTEFKVKAETANESSNLKLTAATATHSQESFPVANAIDGKNDTGWAILPKVGEPHSAIFAAKSPLEGKGDTTLTFTLEFQSIHARHQLSKFRLAATSSAAAASTLTLPPNVQAALKIAADQRNAKQKKDLSAYYRSIAPLLEPLRTEVAAAEKRQKDFLAAAPKCLVTSAVAPREIRVKPRGNWLDDSGEVRPPAIPEFLGKLDAPGRPTRLDLARWIVSRDNPLTARVFVNRLWRLYFGQGISPSVYDFGKQGEKPTHPELLDWLAAEFMDHGWDVKHIVRLMVTSAAYRQSSVPSKQLQERDPQNRLYARQSRWRLDAELVRDNALGISGLLETKVGGPSVFPYQPPGYWSALNFPTREWQNSKGEGLYRRGLYTHWQRTFLHPSLYAFDACTREESAAERPRSNIPQQALVLLNDPTYVEAARVFAERIVKSGATDDMKIQWAFRRALARNAMPAEIKVLVELRHKHLAEFNKDKDAAAKLLGVGSMPAPKEVDAAELASWTSVARAILNLHETITRN